MTFFCLNTSKKRKEKKSTKHYILGKKGGNLEKCYVMSCSGLLRLHSKYCSAHLNNHYSSMEHALPSSVKFHLITSFHAQVWLQRRWLSCNCQKVKGELSQDFFYDVGCPCPTPKSPPAFLFKSPKQGFLRLVLKRQVFSQCVLQNCIFSFFISTGKMRKSMHWNK